jgi:hypothetical protein
VYFYKYQVQFYDEDNGFSRIAGGITADESYTEAMKNIARFYGDDAIERISIEIAVDTLGEAAEDVYELSNERRKKGAKE